MKKFILFIALVLMTGLVWADPTPYPSPVATVRHHSSLYDIAPTPVVYNADVAIPSSSLEVFYENFFGSYPTDQIYFFIYLPDGLWNNGNGLKLYGHNSDGGTWSGGGAKSLTLTALSGLNGNWFSYAMMDQAPVFLSTPGHYEIQAYIAPDLTETPAPWGSPVVIDVTPAPTPTPFIWLPSSVTLVLPPHSSTAPASLIFTSYELNQSSSGAHIIYQFPTPEPAVTQTPIPSFEWYVYIPDNLSSQYISSIGGPGFASVQTLASGSYVYARNPKSITVTVSTFTQPYFIDIAFSSWTNGGWQNGTYDFTQYSLITASPGSTPVQLQLTVEMIVATYTITATPSITITSTITPTVTETVTSTMTATPTATPTATMTITPYSFISITTNAPPLINYGDTITFWINADFIGYDPYYPSAVVYNGIQTQATPQLTPVAVPFGGVFQFNLQFAPLNGAYHTQVTGTTQVNNYGTVRLFGYYYTVGSSYVDVFVRTLTPTITQTATITPTFTLTPFSQPTPQMGKIDKKVIAGNNLNKDGNTTNAMYYYTDAVWELQIFYPKTSQSYQQQILYRSALMLIDLFKTQTNYTTTMKNINKMQPIPKATAQHNYAVAMLTPETLIIEAQTPIARALGVTGTSKTSGTYNSLIKEQSLIQSVFDFITAHQ